MNEKPEEFLNNAEVVAYEFIEELIDYGGMQIYENYLTIASIPHSVKSTIAVSVSMVELLYFRRDTMYSQDKKQKIIENEKDRWVEDIEPIPCSIDTWARNAIPVKKKIRVPKSENIKNIAQPDTKSMKSFSPRRTRISKAQKTNKSMKNIIENHPINEGQTPIPILEDIKEINEEVEFLRSRKEQEMQKRKEDQERVKKIKEEEAELEKKILKDSEEMKNKILTYDYKGKIIQVNPIKSENLPELGAKVRYLSHEPPLIEEVKPDIKKITSKEFVSVKIIKTAPQQEKDWVKNATFIQQQLFETINLSPGVKIIEGTRTKLPPSETPDIFKTMSRKDYITLHKPKSELTYKKNLTPGLSDKNHSSKTSLESMKKTQDSKKDFFDMIPDYNYDDDEDFKEKNIPLITPSKSRNHGNIIQYGADYKLDISAGPNDKFNMEIIHNNKWGINPPVKEPKVFERLPKKPTPKELRDIYGHIVKKPKDKPFITMNELWENKGPKIKKPRDRPNIERVEKKTRMPPPPYRYTMINGLPEIGCLSVSHISGKSLNKSGLIK
ncbi:hypothetical protein SteCoe_24909 [Stentor coeruleus]|uniref:Uncharacterized protein n=1 Tax=Stentor coeruleus TaxID=5963 RepID=A0A1R2BGI6_9CILI|nr:hypothetical protein SteCoe_24909 [Stentor coeruleus]